MKFMIPPEVMVGILRRFYWRLALTEMSRDLVGTEYDEHYLAVSAHGPYPRDTQTLSLKTVARILSCSLSAAQDYIVEHSELVLSDGACRVCELVSGELETQLRRQWDEVGGETYLSLPGIPH